MYVSILDESNEEIAEGSITDAFFKIIRAWGVGEKISFQSRDSHHSKDYEIVEVRKSFIRDDKNYEQLVVKLLVHE